MESRLTECSFYDELVNIIDKDSVRILEPMSQHTTFRTGGAADYFIELKTVKELAAVIGLLKQSGIDYYIVGNGSNLLVGDKGFRGAILTLQGDFKELSIEGDIVTAGGGVLLSKTAQQAQKQALTGLEFASGIPGTIGGAIVMNAGAYGGEMSQVVESIEAVSEEGELLTLSLEELQLGYRTSIFKHKALICTKVRLKLKKGDAAAISAQMEDLMRQRKEKQPLEYPSAGSTFKRPEGYFAGKLIMEAGLRGFQIGGARVSDKHCGFVVNVQQATSKDICQLMEEVSRRVYEKDKVKLEPEICMIGEF